MTTFVGRRQATAELRRMLSESRLVTLTGIGGVGKTRLATHVAREMRRTCRDGVWLVELDRLDDESQIPSAIVVALELHDASARKPTTVLNDYLADRRMLLVLDNCEHLLRGCASVVTELLSAAPGLRILATSREPLGVAGERVFPVRPLTVPDLGEPAQERTARRYSAVTLFEDRASAVVPGFSLGEQNQDIVIRICRWLDGLPLAIELAAAWLRVLTLEQILTRLKDRYRLVRVGDQEGRPDRHQTLRAAVEWSFELCSEPQRTLWARFSVFAGDFDLEAAEAVCSGEGIEAAEVFTGLAALVDKSILVRADSGPRARYRMLDTIRQYGTERLAEANDAGRLSRRHRDYFLTLAERADAASCGPEQTEWCARLCEERANLFAALEYCLTEPGEARVGLRMSATLWWYWIACGFVRDGRNWLDRALSDSEPCHEQVRAMWVNGWVAFLECDNHASLILLRAARDLAERLGDEEILTYALQYLAVAELFIGNNDLAIPMLEEAMSRHRRAEGWTAPGLLIFGQRARLAFLSGDLEHALRLLSECVSICDAMGERWTRSWTEWNLGVTWWAVGDLKAATSYLHSALRNKEELNDQLGIPFCVEVLAWVAMTSGDAHRAAVLFGAADNGWERIGGPLFGFGTLLDWRGTNRARARDALDERGYESACRQGAYLAQEDLIAYALGETTEPAAGSEAPESEQMLTKREREVAAMVAQGMTNREIAASLVIAQRTAEGHVENILSKLGVTSRTQIAVWVSDQAGS
jgi:non-specific serine/threonine protein kinase